MGFLQVIKILLLLLLNANASASEQTQAGIAKDPCDLRFAEFHKFPLEIKDPQDLEVIGKMSLEEFERFVKLQAEHLQEKLNLSGVSRSEDLLKIQKFVETEEAIPGLARTAARVLRDDRGIKEFADNLSQLLKLQEKIIPLVRRKSQLTNGYDGPGVKSFITPDFMKRRELASVSSAIQIIQKDIFDIEQRLQAQYFTLKDKHAVLSRLSRAFWGNATIRLDLSMSASASLRQTGSVLGIDEMFSQGKFADSTRLETEVNQRLGEISKIGQLYEQRRKTTDLGITIEKFLEVDLPPNILQLIGSYESRLTKAIADVDSKKSLAVVREERNKINRELQSLSTRPSDWNRIQDALDRSEAEVLKRSDLPSTANLKGITANYIARKGETIELNSALLAHNESMDKSTAPAEIVKLFRVPTNNFNEYSYDIYRHGRSFHPTYKNRSLLGFENSEAAKSQFERMKKALVFIQSDDAKPVFFNSQYWADLSPSGKTGVFWKYDENNHLVYHVARSDDLWKDLNKIQISPIPSLSPVKGEAQYNLKISNDEKSIFEIKKGMLSNRLIVHPIDGDKKSLYEIPMGYTDVHASSRIVEQSQDGRFLLIDNDKIIDLKSRKLLKPPGGYKVSSFSKTGAVLKKLINERTDTRDERALYKVWNFEKNTTQDLKDILHPVLTAEERARFLEKTEYYQTILPEISQDGRSLLLKLPKTISRDYLRAEGRFFMEIDLSRGVLTKQQELPASLMGENLYSPDGRYAITPWRYEPRKRNQSNQEFEHPFDTREFGVYDLEQGKWVYSAKKDLTFQNEAANEQARRPEYRKDYISQYPDILVAPDGRIFTMENGNKAGAVLVGEDADTTLSVSAINFELEKKE